MGFEVVFEDGGGEGGRRVECPLHFSADGDQSPCRGSRSSPFLPFLSLTLNHFNLAKILLFIMKRTRASPSSINPKVTLYSLVPPSAAAASSTAFTSSLPPLPSTSSSSSSATTSAHFDTKPTRRQSTLLASSRSYAEEEDEEDQKVEDEHDDQDDFLPDPAPPSSSALPPRPRSSTFSSSNSNKKPKLSSPTKSALTPWKAPPEPPNWRAQVDAIREMRSTLVAPVDDMGCAAAGRQESDPVRGRFSVLISLMLSSQTKGEFDLARREAEGWVLRVVRLV